MPHRRTTDTEPMDRILLWAVRSQASGDPSVLDWPQTEDDHPVLRRELQSLKKGKSAGVDNIPVELVWTRWRGCNHRSDDNVQQDLTDRKMVNPVDPVLSHRTSQERQPAAVTELPNNKPHQSPNQSHAEDHTEQIEATSGEDHRRRTGRLQSRKEYHRADLKSTHSLREISPALARPLPCLHKL